jgi:hypothetical protein
MVDGKIVRIPAAELIKRRQLISQTGDWLETQPLKLTLLHPLILKR